MQMKTTWAAPTAARDRTKRRIGVRARMAAAGFGIALAVSSAGAAGHAGAAGIVRFTGALVDRYDVTFDTPSLGASGSASAAALRFDAHGRRLPGAHLALVGPDGQPLSQPAGAAVRATWHDARDDRAVPLEAGRAHRVGPYGGVLTIAGPDMETGAVAPVVIRIRHP
ncbi:thioesterase [Burkholderia sp. Bp9090]|uniref:thioesterase n=1 Tax=unclassified Burkholderia TaxID=2613784 RepID=UPI000F5685DE|nr:thioesterase [Burkholderia sp. Bp9011]RQR94359.1 thioesterase [Burkholderia sp. Bp9010]RQS11835.1 thioesterase [Burkholderia sp. Bp8991]RQS79507.1 thioesterase [Burkholderia sp. Bp8977]RQZ41373.1 thioesterase [Burkholderia sp. Bp9090]